MKSSQNRLKWKRNKERDNYYAGTKLVGDEAYEFRIEAADIENVGRVYWLRIENVFIYDNVMCEIIPINCPEVHRKLKYAKQYCEQFCKDRG